MGQKFKTSWMGLNNPFPLFMEPISLVYYIWETRTNTLADRVVRDNVLYSNQ